MKTRNKFEQKIYNSLRRGRRKFKYETERIPYILPRHYIPDFIIETRNGKLYIECKGYLRPEDKSKLVAVKRCNPNLDIRIVFYSATPKNIKWAERNSFKYSISSIPKEWLEGF